MRKRLKPDRHRDLTTAHGEHELVSTVTVHSLVPGLESLQVGRVQFLFHPLPSFGNFGLIGRRLQSVDLLGDPGLIVSPTVIPSDLLHDLRQVTAPLWRYHMLFDRVGGRQFERRGVGSQAAAELVGDPLDQGLIEPVGTGIVEVRSDGLIDRQGIVFPVEDGSVSAVLLPHLSQRIVGTLLVGLIDRNQVGVLEHVDLFQL